jgi:wobble nucleotide-excising tRNase
MRTGISNKAYLARGAGVEPGRGAPNMLKKFIAVKNVGRFINSAHTGVQECLKTTLVLGGNGFGKTTLASILRSNGTNDPAIIAGRARLGATSAPDVEMLLEVGKATFRNGAWNLSAPEFLVFDGVFIVENAFAGDVVDLEQRRNLYRVIVGKEGVGLAVEEERLAAESRNRASEINATEKAIRSHVPTGMKIDEFIALPAEPDVDAKIAAQAKAIEAVRAAAQLKARAGLNLVRVPDLPADLEAILGKTLKGIAEDAQKSIAEHIVRHGMQDGGEEWLQQGTGYIADGECPYCGQALKGLSLVKAYQQVFAETYEQLKSSAVKIRESIERDFGDRATGTIATLVEANNGAIEFWSRYSKLPELVAPQDIAPAISALATAVLAQLAKKMAAPQEAVEPDTAYGKALKQFEAARTSVNNGHERSERGDRWKKGIGRGGRSEKGRGGISASQCAEEAPRCERRSLMRGPSASPQGEGRSRRAKGSGTRETGGAFRQSDEAVRGQDQSTARQF